MMVSIVALPAGILLDSTGTGATLVVAGVVEVAGSVLMATADSKTFDVFLYAYSALGVGGALTMFAAFSGAATASPQVKLAYVSACSCLFDASVIVFQMFYGMNILLGVSRSTLFLGHAVLAAVMYTSMVANYIPIPCCFGGLAPSKPSHSMIRAESMKRFHQSVEVEGYGSIDSQVQDGELKEERIPVKHMDLCRQLRTYEFWFMVICCSVGILRANLFIGMNPVLLDGLGDHKYHTDAYKQVFNYVLACGFVFIPIIAWCAQLVGLLNSLQIANMIGIVAFAFGLVPLLPVQVLTFIVFTAFRAFLYAIVSAYNLHVFGIGTFGKIQGLMFTLGATINLLQVPIVTWSLEETGNMDLTCYMGIGMGMFVLLITELSRSLAWIRPEELEDMDDFRSNGHVSSRMVSPIHSRVM